MNIRNERRETCLAAQRVEQHRPVVGNDITIETTAPRYDIGKSEPISR